MPKTLGCTNKVSYGETKTVNTDCDITINGKLKVKKTLTAKNITVTNKITATCIEADKIVADQITAGTIVDNGEEPSFVQKYVKYWDERIQQGEYEASSNVMMEFVIATATADVQALVNARVGAGKYLVSDSSSPPFSLPAGQHAMIYSVLKDVAEEYKTTDTKNAYNQWLELNIFAFRLSDSKLVILNLGTYAVDPTLQNTFFGVSAVETATKATITDSIDPGAGTRTFSCSFESAGFTVSSPLQANWDFSITFTPSVITTDQLGNGNPVTDLFDSSQLGVFISTGSGTEVEMNVGQLHHPTLLTVGSNLTTMSINGVSIVSAGAHVLADTTVSTTVTVAGVDLDLYRVAAFTQYRNGYHRIAKRA